MKIIVLSLIGFYLLVLLLLYVFQRSLLYYPTAYEEQSRYDSFELTSGRLKVKVVTENTDAEAAVIYFGGNAESAWWTPKTMGPILNLESSVGKAVYYLNYPGYGGSEGKPTQTGILKAANNLYDYVSARHSNVSLIGRSLGSGVAMDVASKHPVEKLVLISPYDSIANVAQGHYPLFPVKWLIFDQYNSIKRAKKVNADVLVFVGSEDRVVPVSHTEKLVDILEKRVSVKVELFEGYEHNNIESHQEFAPAIQRFLEVEPQ